MPNCDNMHDRLWRCSTVPSVKPSRLLAAMIAVIIAAQLVNMGLQRLRPSPLPTLFSAASALAGAYAPSLGPATADFVILLFSDYACPLCRAMHRDLRTLVATDHRVRIIYRDWPVLSPRSVRAARLAIASVRQGRHAAFDDELMQRGGSLDEPLLRAAATRADVDWARLVEDAERDALSIDQLLDASSRVARGASFAGTPTIVIGPYLSSGRISLERMRELVAAARNRSLNGN